MAARISIKNNKNGKPYFNVIADNGQVLATSEEYSEYRYALQGAKSVLKVVRAHDFEIEDERKS